jgi:hypothetical protein
MAFAVVHVDRRHNQCANRIANRDTHAVTMDVIENEREWHRQKQKNSMHQREIFMV